MIKFEEGTPDTMIARLRDAIAGFDKKWEKKCRPAPEKKIQKLKAIVGKYHWELPDSYLDYLRAMGKNDEGLLGNEWDGCETDIDEVLEFYCGELDSEFEECLEKGYLAFSFNWTDAKLYLNLSGEEPQVIRGAWRPEVEYIAGSFEKYLFRQAFKRYQETFAYHAWESDSVCKRERKEKCSQCSLGGKTADERMAYVRHLTQTYGLEGAWFSDRVNFYWYNEKYALDINVQEGFQIGFWYNDASLKEHLIYLFLRKTQEWLYQYISSQEEDSVQEG